MLDRLVALSLIGLGAATSGAATQITVNVLNDNVTVNGDCSLREAIRAADTNASVDGCPAGSGTDTIVLPVGTVTFDGGIETIDDASAEIILRGASSDRSLSIVSCAFHPFLDIGSGARVSLEDFSVTLCDSGTEKGGAVYVSGADLIVKNMSFSFNAASFNGGAIYFYAGGGTNFELRIEDSELGFNSVDDGSPDSDPRGGAVYALLRGSSDVIVERTLFSSNTLVSTTRPSAGGGMWIYAENTATVTLRDLEFVNNRCAAFDANHRGCGLSLGLTDSAKASVDGVELEGNYGNAATIFGATSGLHASLTYDAELTLDRCHLHGNENPLSTTEDDYQLSVQTADAAIALARNCLLYDGVTGFQGSAVETSSLRFDHITSADNQWGAKLFQSGSGALTVQNSILWANTESAVLQTGSIGLASNNLQASNPLFVNAPAGNYRLSSGSPDRDAGDRALTGVGLYDLDHAARVAGTETDRGAYEYGGIFADGFESGDVAAWSASTP